MKTAIGVLIPTYNRKAYLEEAVRSVSGQTYSNLEIIVIDNGSCDECGNLVARLKDPRIQYVHNKKNLGLLGSIRKGMKLFSSRTVWCTILPDDDLLDQAFILSMAEYVRCHPQIDVVHGHRILIDANGNRRSQVPMPPERETAFEYLTNRARLVRKTFLTGVFFSRAAYESIGGYPRFTTGMASDDGLIFALAIKQGLYFNRYAVSSIRRHAKAESLSGMDPLRHFQAMSDFCVYVQDQAKKNRQFSELEMEKLQRVLACHMKHVVSGLWLRSVHRHLREGKTGNARALQELYDIVPMHRYQFSRRVRLSVQVATKIGYFPEQNFFYRAGMKATSLLGRLRLRLSHDPF